MLPVALVTGASSGIGAATCRRLRRAGWRVIGLARRPSPDADDSLQVDVSSYRDVDDAFRRLPELKLVVHAAAIVGPVVPLPQGDPGEWGRTVEVNMLGTYNVLRSALAGPLSEEGGVAIHITSGAAATAKPYWSAYSASKAGAEHLVRSVAMDLEGSGRAVCSLDPGLTETPMQEEIRSLDFPDREQFLRAHERRSARMPEDVSDAVVELLLRDPWELNGQTFRVGWL